ncbi:uncharacterized protein LOC131239890 [Magnolia sinica]|uniref:uncharacterized protein LOC131239890 n=1 Tax=Magnolia sinica TaxID=86752 RepID=UPI002658DBA5|nr:uncharacterized protein LOC131239890 [Magnolia sinica]
MNMEHLAQGDQLLSFPAILVLKEDTSVTILFLAKDVSADVTFLKQTSYFSKGGKSLQLEANPITTLPVVPNVSMGIFGEIPLQHTNKPLQVYSRCSKHGEGVYLVMPSSNPLDLLTDLHPSKFLSTSPNEGNLPIALSKETHSYTQHPISNVVSFTDLSPSFRQFALLSSSMSISHSFQDFLKYERWKGAMEEEIVELHQNQNSILVDLFA